MDGDSTAVGGMFGATAGSTFDVACGSLCEALCPLVWMSWVCGSGPDTSVTALGSD